MAFSKSWLQTAAAGLVFTSICCLVADAQVSPTQHNVPKTAGGARKTFVRTQPYEWWTTEPKCSDNSQSGNMYCVYTSSTFANGRGISVLASPDHAKAMAELPAFTDPDIHTVHGINSFPEPSYKMVPIEGRGIGVISNRTIERGEIVISTTPSFLTSDHATGDLDLETRLELQNHGFNALPAHTRNMSAQLYGRGGHDHMDNIITNNAYSFPEVTANEATPGREAFAVAYSALFPEHSRFNHGCRPNMEYTFDHATLTMFIFAARDVFSGEELTTTYILPVQRRKSRRKSLKRSWGFECNCSHCSMSEADVRESDARTAHILQIQEELEDPYTTFGYTAAVGVLGEKLIELFQKEQLWAMMHDVYSSAALQHSGVGDMKRTRKRALHSLQRGQQCRSAHHGSDQYINMQLLLKDPTQDQSWNYLRKQVGDLKEQKEEQE